MEKLNIMSDEEIINYYYAISVSGIKESWFSNSEDWYNYIVNLPDKERVTYLISILDKQVFNGGFNQYFVNGYGQFAKETVIALQAINANDMANILQIAYEEVNSPGYDDHTFRQKILRGEIDALYEDDDDLNNYLEYLDGKYYEYPDNLGLLLGNYLRGNLPNLN